MRTGEGRVTRCRGCGADIVFVTTEQGKQMPVNAEPYVTVVVNDGRVVRGRVSHFATCPAAKAFRRREPGT